jgi:glycosyltransferase involved in cell wall biosynthesis
MSLDLSVVVPLFDEEESLPELVEWIDRVACAHNLTYEIILVDDGSRDGSWRVIEQLKQVYPQIIGIRFQRNYGKSAALQVGFSHTQGAVVITMDADLQDSPDEIPELRRMILEEGYDLVSGYKKTRHDPLSKTLPSKFFNRVTRWITGIKLNDFNCGLKAYNHRVVRSIEVYGEMHRYIPYLAKGAGFKRIGEKVVTHYPRKYGSSKFGFERFINGFLDLLSVYFVVRFGRRPMHFFGTMGILSFLSGAAITAYLIAEKIFRLWVFRQPPSAVREVVDQPLFYISLVALVVGMQLFLAGFLGELISRNASDRNNYLVDQVLK